MLQVSVVLIINEESMNGFISLTRFFPSYLIKTFSHKLLAPSRLLVHLQHIMVKFHFKYSNPFQCLQNWKEFEVYYFAFILKDSFVRHYICKTIQDLIWLQHCYQKGL